MSAASSSATSSTESRRRIGSGGAIESSAPARLRPSSSPSPRRRRRLRSPTTVGTVGVPSLIQPWSSAVSWQSGQTSTSSAPSSGEKRIARSPISSVRSQIAQTRVVPALVTYTNRL